MGYYVYMLECGDGTLYAGITNDYQKRLVQHRTGKGARYTKARGVKAIVYIEPVANKSAALKREAYIKRMKRVQKLQLIKAAYGS